MLDNLATLLKVNPNSLGCSLLVAMLFLAPLAGEANAARRKACVDESGKITISRRCKAARGQTDLSLELLSTSVPGPKGQQGPEGPVGAKGEQGNVGSPGQKGMTGPTGPMGDKGATGIAGQQGPEGLKGATGFVGSPGVTGYTRTSSADNVIVQNGNTISVETQCGEGKVVLGGGCEQDNFGSGPLLDLYSSSSLPDVLYVEHKGWKCEWVNRSGGTAFSLGIAAYAFCIDKP